MFSMSRKWFLVVAVTITSACRTASPAACPSLLSHRLSLEEDKIREMLPNSRLPVTLGAGNDVLWKGIVDKERISKSWNDFLVRLKSSAELEMQVLGLLEGRYRDAFAKHEESIVKCKPKPGEYDGSWTDALYKEHGEKLKANAAALRSAVMLAYSRAANRCQNATRTALLITEIEYRVALDEMLNDWGDFVRSDSIFSPPERAMLLRRLEEVAGVFHRTTITRIAVESRDLARFELEARELPVDIAATLSRQTVLSRPFSAGQASEDLNRVLK